MEQEAEQRWSGLEARLGGSLGHVLADLRTRHTQSWRAYHTLEHVMDVLGLLDGCVLSDRTAVELAAWFHDAVYDPRATDNEEASARLAREQLAGRVTPALLGRVEALIRVTATHTPGDDADAAAFVDADLSILGSEPERYEAYASAIRREYGWVPDAEYRVGRARVLNGFLARPHLFWTPAFRDRFEVRARANLAREVAWLSRQTVE